MFEKLKKKHMVHCVLWCLVLWAIAGVILGLNLESVKVLFEEPVALENFTLVFLGLIVLVLLLVGVGILISGLRGSNLKELEKYCAATGNKEYEMQKLEQFYQMGTPVQGIRINNDYFMAVNGTNIKFAPAKQLLWAYTHVVQHRTNFIPTGKTYSIIVKLSDGRQLDISMANQDACDQALEYIATNCPYLFIGYDKEWERMYNKNRDEMIRLVRGRMGQQEMEQQDMPQM